MEHEYLGDALDYYKRWFLKEACAKQLVDLKALPMSLEGFGDNMTKYAALLGMAEGDVILREPVPNQRDRKKYFAFANDFPNSDLFADPNTGFYIGRKSPYANYLFGRDADVLLPAGTNRVLVVYDQSISRGSEIGSAVGKITTLKPRFLALAYCAQAAMLILARQDALDRMESIRDQLQQLDYVRHDRVVSNFQ